MNNLNLIVLEWMQTTDISTANISVSSVLNVLSYCLRLIFVSSMARESLTDMSFIACLYEYSIVLSTFGSLGWTKIRVVAQDGRRF